MKTNLPLKSFNLRLLASSTELAFFVTNISTLPAAHGTHITHIMY